MLCIDSRLLSGYQMIRICKPDSLKELGIDMESLFALGLGKAPAAYMEKFEEGDGLFNDTPVDGEGNTRLHDAARRGLFAFAGLDIPVALCHTLLWHSVQVGFVPIS